MDRFIKPFLPTPFFPLIPFSLCVIACGSQLQSLMLGRVWTVWSLSPLLMKMWHDFVFWTSMFQLWNALAVSAELSAWKHASHFIWSLNWYVAKNNFLKLFCCLFCNKTMWNTEIWCFCNVDLLSGWMIFRQTASIGFMDFTRWVPAEGRDLSLLPGGGCGLGGGTGDGKMDGCVCA